jgi:dipeptidyl aminopeptidase/acylaminoacyl peptidase
LLDDSQDLSYSPDGRQIAYVQPSDSSLWVRDAGGGHARQLTALRSMLPSWSPDGNLLAFTALTHGANWRLYLMSPNGEKPQALPDPDAANGQGGPTWLPDGQALIYADTWCGTPSDCGIHRLDLRTRQVSLLPGSVGLRTARVSPDGRWVTALKTDSQYVVLGALGPKPVWKTLWPHAVGDYLAWSADSRAVYCVTITGGLARAERLALDGQAQTVAEFRDPAPADVTSFGWFGLGPGDSILLSHLTHGSEIVAFPLVEH